MIYSAQLGFSASLSGLPWFALYFAVAVSMMAIFVAIYIRLTEHREIELIQQGNIAAALALGGAMVGFAIPLSKSVAQAVSIPDMLIWSLAAFAVQIVVFSVVKLFIRDLSDKISNGNVAAGLFLAGCAISIGMLNASAMSL